MGSPTDDDQAWIDAGAPYVLAPEAVPRAGDAAELTITLPRMLITIAVELARREGVSVDVLVMRMLEEKTRIAHAQLKKTDVEP